MSNHSGMVSINLTERATRCLEGAADINRALNKAIFYAHKALLAVSATPAALEVTSDCSKSNGNYGTTVVNPSTRLPVVVAESDVELTVGPQRFNVTRETREAIGWYCKNYNVSRMSAYSTLICFGTHAQWILEKGVSGKIESSVRLPEKFALPDDFDKQLKRHHVPEQATSA